MLYVSRRVNFADFMVVDTDDGKEEIVSWSKLRKVVHDGVKVEGVNLFRTELGSYQCVIDVYQPTETMTQLQLKTKVIHGVDIKTYGTQITAISLLGSRNKVVIRLADYGTSLAGFLLSGNEPGYKGDITFVLDSSLRIGYEPFSLARVDIRDRYTIGSFGVKLDLRGILGESVYGIYKAIYEVAYDDTFNEIIDIPERKQLMRGKVLGL